MIMISSLIDELLELALWLDDEFYDAEATKVRDAADTISQLRDDLQQANAKNAKLRGERDMYRYLASWMVHPNIPNQLRAENAKLRKLVRDVYVLCWHGMDCNECPWFDECNTDGRCPWLSIMHDHMHELGVEVDE